MMAARFATLLSACLLAVAAFAPASTASAQEHHHHMAASAASDAAAMFAADATLSREMAAIRAGLAAHLAEPPGGGDAGAAADGVLGRDLEARIGTIIRECRLPEDADAVLHGYLARMLTAAGTLQRADTTASERHSAVQAAVHAYDDYGARFTDPAWKALAAE